MAIPEPREKRRDYFAGPDQSPSICLNVGSVIHFTTVAKSNKYWQGIKSIAFGETF